MQPKNKKPINRQNLFIQCSFLLLCLAMIGLIVTTVTIVFSVLATQIVWIDIFTGYVLILTFIFFCSILITLGLIRETRKIIIDIFKHLTKPKGV